MDIFIQSSACISPQKTFEETYFFEALSTIPVSTTLNVQSPDYKEFIPPNMIRRASHVLKMGIGAGLMCLKKNENIQPDAILVGTAMGCFEDTDKFLRSIDENQERTLTPTSFIQSTHNTVAGQIALLTKNHCYNLTYVHQNLSFEFALLDACLLLKEEEAKTVLVGAVDELIPPLVELFDRAGHIKKQEDLQTEIWNSKTPGYLAGEGSSFFSFSSEKTNSSTSKLKGLKTLQRISDAKDLQNQLDIFLKEIGLNKNEINLILSGVNGDVNTDANLNQFTKELQLPTAYFKHYCGEYFSSSGFALWFADKIISKQEVPASAGLNTKPSGAIVNILIVNHYQNKHYSFICVSAC